jgi:hypothetical protein
LEPARNPGSFGTLSRDPLPPSAVSEYCLAISIKSQSCVALVDCGLSLRGGPMARTLREVIAAVQAERRAKIAAAYRQKLIAKKKKRQLEEAKRVIELDRNLIVTAVLIVALPIIAALAAMLTILAVGDH